MKKLHLWLALTGALMLCVGGRASAQNLLTNGNLEDPPDESDLATGWTLTEGPDTMPAPPATPEPANSATFIGFANNTPGGERGLWLRSFEGGLNDEQPDMVFADLTQVVPATAGLPYELSAWSRWEMFYSGGVDNLNIEDDDPPDDGPESPTETFLALEFLDAGSNVLPGSIVLDLRTEQMNDNMWRQHLLSATAPAGTVNIQVRASMVDGLLNPGVNPQSAFFDDFVLQVIPEPATIVLGLLGALGLMGLVRRRW